MSELLHALYDLRLRQNYVDRASSDGFYGDWLLQRTKGGFLNTGLIIESTSVLQSATNPK